MGLIKIEIPLAECVPYIRNRRAMDEIIVLEPCRNLLAFSNFSDIDYNICNTALKRILKHIVKVITEYIPKDIKHFAGSGKHNFEVRANDFNWSLRLSTKSEQLIASILQSYMADGKCVYLEITNNNTKTKTIHKDGKYHDILELDYHPLSFRQPDDNIRHTIISFFQNEIKFLDTLATIVFIGGECTLFGKVFSKIFSKIFSDKLEIHSRHYFLTDFQSIYDDLKYNYSNSENISLIDYKTCSLEWEKYTGSEGMCIIANTGYQGLGANLANELTRSGSAVIYIISCNQTSFQKDFAILETNYFIERKTEIKTNYSIWIYKLILHNVKLDKNK